jgi:hypothetical protein
MTTVKGILVGVLSFFLMLSLIIFGVSFMVKSTAMNPDFITDRVDQADLTQLANDFVDEYYVEEIPEDMRFFEDVVYEVIADHESWLKEQFSAAVHDGYDYLLDKTDTLEIIIPLENLKESVRESLWLHFMEKLPEWISSPDDEGLKKLIYDNIDNFVEEIPEGYLPDDYSMLPEVQLRQYVDAYFEDLEEQIIDGRLSPSLQAEIEDLLLPYFNQYYDEIVEEVPSEFVINEDEIDSDAMETLETVRGWVGVFNAVYYALIGFMVLLVAGIVLLHFNVKGATRSLAKTFLVYGIGEFVAVMVARYIVPNLLPTGDLPVSFQDFIKDAYTGLLAPLQWFSLGILIAGVALLLVSIFYKRGKVAEAED